MARTYAHAPERSVMVFTGLAFSLRSRALADGGTHEKEASTLYSLNVTTKRAPREPAESSTSRPLTLSAPRRP
jgi:hypothetical protein